MVNVLNSSVIGGNLVQLDNKNRYHVTDRSGKRKVLTRDQFKRNLENNYEKVVSGEDIKFKKPMSAAQKTLLTLLGLGTAAAGYIYRKDITKFFKSPKLKEKFNDLAASESGEKIKAKVGEVVETVTEAVKKPSETAAKVGEAAREITEKATTKTLNAWERFAKFVRGFKKK